MQIGRAAAKEQRGKIVKKVLFFSCVGGSTLLRLWFDSPSKQRVSYQWKVNLNNRIFLGEDSAGLKAKVKQDNSFFLLNICFLLVFSKKTSKKLYVSLFFRYFAP